MTVLCFVALPHGAILWSAVCDCGIFLSYSLNFGVNNCMYNAHKLPINVDTC